MSPVRLRFRGDPGLPVDAAGLTYPVDNLRRFARAGADLVCHAAKYFDGPHSTGLIVGRKDLVDLGQADGTWQAVEIPALRKSILARSVAAADFDGDGRTELAVGYLSIELGVWRSGIDVFEMQADDAADVSDGFTRRPTA